MSGPVITVDHRPRHCQEMRVFDIDDIEDLPSKVKLSSQKMYGLEHWTPGPSLNKGVIREIRNPPKEWLNVWIKLDYLGDDVLHMVPLLFDVDGVPYIMAPPKNKTDMRIQVCIKEADAEELLWLLAKATDFCDSCSKPLDPSIECSYLEHDGESIADVYGCTFCDGENIRWSKSFLEWHPELLESLKRQLAGPPQIIEL